METEVTGRKQNCTVTRYHHESAAWKDPINTETTEKKAINTLRSDRLRTQDAGGRRQGNNSKKSIFITEDNQGHKEF